MRRWIALVLFLMLALGTVFLTQVAPIVVKNRLIAAVRRNCGGCEFSVDRLRVHWASREVITEGIRYRSHRDQPVEVTFEFERLEGQIALLPLFHRTWEFKQILAIKPMFQVIENDPKPPSTSSPESFPLNLPPLMISTLVVNDGRLTYIHRTHAQDAVIRVSNIEGTARNFSSRLGLGRSTTAFEVSGQLERSGRCQIHASFDLLAAKNDDHIEIDLQHQALSELDPYFFKDDGVRLEGVLERAAASMDIRRGILSGNLVARYHDLVVHYFPTPDRSSVGAFFSETLQKLLTQKNQDHQDSPGVRFQVARKPDESIIKFMLSGLVPAARTILTTRTSPG